MAGERAPLPRTLSGLGYGEAIAFATLRGYLRADGMRVLIERHPLWQETHPAWQEARRAAELRYRAAEIGGVDPFLALRRPAQFVGR